MWLELKKQLPTEDPDCDFIRNSDVLTASVLELANMKCNLVKVEDEVVRENGWMECLNMVTRRKSQSGRGDTVSAFYPSNTSYFLYRGIKGQCNEGKQG